MANMSHCRFHNTLQDLQECMEALNNGEYDTLSPNEKKNADRMIKICNQIAEDYCEDYPTAD